MEEAYEEESEVSEEKVMEELGIVWVGEDESPEQSKEEDDEALGE